MSRATISRPTYVTAVLAALVLALLAAVGGGVALSRDTGGSVTVLAPWTGREEEDFRAVLADFTADTGIRVEYQGTRALREVLRAQVQSGNPPDIAVMPTLGDLEEYAADQVLKPLDEILPGADYGPPWTPAPDSGALLYWVPVRVGLKSIVWFDSRRHSPGDLPGLAADGDRWCVGMGSDATSGWPGTDWIEDILLQQAGPETYERWTVGEDLAWTDPQVRKAWRTWAELLTKGVAPDAPGRALTTDFRDAGIRPKDNRCRLEHQGSFIRDVEARRRADFVPFAGFLPETASTARVYEVSADMAALFRDTGESRKLLRYLVKDSTQRALGARAGTLSANRGVPPEAYRPSATGEKLARTLRDADARCLDASDAMPAAMRHAFQRAVLEYLSLQQGMADRGIADPMKVLEGLDQVQRSVRDQAHPPAADICG